MNIVKEDTKNISKENIACIYSRSKANTNKANYDRKMIERNATVPTQTIENINVQNKLKQLGFYNANTTSDGNLQTAESVKALKNFQTVYGLTANGVCNNATIAKLATVVNTYNSAQSKPKLSSIAQLKSGYSDYNESVIKDNICKVWTFLKVGMGLDNMHASAVLGNIMEESGCSSTNAQDINGSNNMFDNNYSYNCNDSRGYGIIQWTYSSRKAGLQTNALNMGLSVGDINAQMAYLRLEAEGNDYSSAWTSFTNANTLTEATDVFRSEFEQTPNGVSARRTAANTVYNAFA